MNLLPRIATAYERRDPVPAGVLLAAGRAWLSRPRPSARRLALIRDTALGLGPAVRGGAHALDFADPTLMLTVEVEPSGRNIVRLTGFLDAPDRADLVVRWPDGEVTVPVDDLGGFTATVLPSGPLCIEVRHDRESAVTPWFLG